MEQKKPDPPQPASKASTSTLASRPAVPSRNESLLPPHYRPSITEVPVTPGITRGTYDSDFNAAGDASIIPDYFSQKVSDHAIAASPAPVRPVYSSQHSFNSLIAAGASESTEFLRRLNTAVMGDHRESISDIRKSSPNLGLSGNIISATFNIPHSLKYHKGTDWVSLAPYHLSCLEVQDQITMTSNRRTCSPLQSCQDSEWWG